MSVVGVEKTKLGKVFMFPSAYLIVLLIIYYSKLYIMGTCSKIRKLFKKKEEEKERKKGYLYINYCISRLTLGY